MYLVLPKDKNKVVSDIRDSISRAKEGNFLFSVLTNYSSKRAKWSIKPRDLKFKTKPYYGNISLDAKWIEEPSKRNRLASFALVLWPKGIECFPETN